MATFARFPSLPNEIKLRTIETADPEDVENLASCCKSVYSLANKTLRQHKEDKDTWSSLNFSFESCPEDAECLEAFCKLREIVTNRRLGRYPKKVALQSHQCPLIPPHCHEMQDILIHVCDEIFQDLESPYINQAEMKTWYKRLIDDRVTTGCSHTTPATANALLFTVLPNVERVSIPWQDPLGAETPKIIRTISTVNRDAPLFMRNRLSLTRLVEFDLWVGNGNNGNTGLFEAFMTLPSLRILRLRSMGRGYKLNNFLDSNPPSMVTEIHCLHCKLTATQLARLLDHVESLRVLSYDQHYLHYPRSILKETSPVALLEVVFRYAKTSLTYLNYAANAIMRDREGSTSVDTIGPVGSFRGYEALKVLRINCALLFEDAREEVCKRLINELPMTLEELELVGLINPKGAQLLFAGMLEVKRERLPNLRYVVFDRQIPFDEETITAYKRAGLIIDWRKFDDMNLRHGRFYKTNGLWIGGVERMRPDV